MNKRSKRITAILTTAAICASMLTVGASAIYGDEETWGTIDDPIWSPNGSAGLQVRGAPAPRNTENSIHEGPVQTHKWWSSLIMSGEGWSKDLLSFIADPLVVWSKEDGSNPRISSENNCHVYNGLGPGNPGFRVDYEGSDFAGFEPLSGSSGSGAKLYNYSDWGVQWTYFGGDIMVSLSNGSPYVYLDCKNGIKFTTKNKVGDDLKITYQSDNVIALESHAYFWDDYSKTGMYGGYKDNWAIYAPTGSKLEVSTNAEGQLVISSDLAGKGYCSVAFLPNVDTDEERLAEIELYKKYAYNFVTDTKMSYDYQQEEANVKTTFDVTVDKKEGNTEGTMFALYPHQWTNFRDTSALTGLEYRSTRGLMKLIESPSCSFSTDMKFTGVMPQLPFAAPDSPYYDKEQLKSLIADQLKGGYGANIQAGNCCYFKGVTIGRTAQLIDIADQLGMTEERDELISWVKYEVENLLSYSGDGDDCYLVYNPDYAALVPAPCVAGMFHDLHFNDGHFTIGYFLKGAAEVARYDQEWAKKWAPKVEILIKYVDNWEREDTEWPYMRYMDVYQGHSWATGDAKFNDGNNQESTSEAMNFNSGVFLWGQAIGDQDLIDLGAYLYTTGAEGTLNYWFDVNDLVFPKGEVGPKDMYPDWSMKTELDMAYAGFIFGAKTEFATWFGNGIGAGSPTWPLGINILPCTASSLYLGRYPEEIQEDFDWIERVFGMPIEQCDNWNEIMWVYQAMLDPDAAWHNYVNNPHGKETPQPSSETEPHTYTWINDLVALGRYCPEVTANTGSYAVFEKNGVKTYAVYNFTDEEIRVKFSDGAVVVAPPKQLFYTNKADKLCADAGKDMTVLDKNVDGKETFTLDGSNSTYSQGTIVDYKWSIDEKVVATGANPTITLENGKYVITLTVTSNDGYTATDDVTVYVTDGKPFAEAGADKTVVDYDGSGSEEVKLNGTKSLDPDKDAIVSYEWLIDDKVVATGDVVTVEIPTGKNVVTLKVTDDDGNVAYDDVIVSVCPEIGSIADITVSSTGDGSFANINDGNYTTSWSSVDSNDKQFVQFDFGNTQEIVQANIKWDSCNFAKAYDVLVSDDKDFATYDVLATVENYEGGESVIKAEEAVSGRYLRIVLNSSNGAVKEYPSEDGKYTLKIASSSTGKPTVTFETNSSDLGKGFCYICLNVNGNTIGDYVAKVNVPYTIDNVKNGDIVKVGYKVSSASSGQIITPTYEFTVGNVNGGNVFTINEAMVYGGVNGTIPQVEKYNLKINDGTGTGRYKEGAAISVVAKAPVEEGYEFVFEKWTGDTDYINNAAITNAAITVNMPAKDIELTAVFEKKKVETEIPESSDPESSEPESSDPEVTDPTSVSFGDTGLDMNGNAATIWFKADGFKPAFIYCEFSINGNGELSYPMQLNAATGLYEYTINNVNAGDTVVYSLKYEKKGPQVFTKDYTVTIGETESPVTTEPEVTEPDPEQPSTEGYGVTSENGGATIWFVADGFTPSFIYVNFNLNNTYVQSYGMSYNSSKGRYEYHINNANKGDSLEYSFKYTKNGPQVFSEVYTTTIR